MECLSAMSGWTGQQEAVVRSLAGSMHERSEGLALTRALLGG